MSGPVLAHTPDYLLALLFEPRDLWVGVYWKRFREGPHLTTVIYLCLVPTLPIRLSVSRWSA